MTANTISAADARRAARNAGAIAAASIVSKGALFVWQLVLARALGETFYGIYGTVGAFIAIGTSVVNFGMGPIVIRDVARRPDLAGKYLTATLVMQSALAVLAYGLVTGAAVVTGYSTEIQLFLAVAAVSLLVDVLGNMTNDLLLAQERMFASSVVSVTHIAVLIGMAGLALLGGYGLLGVYAATIASGVVRAAALWGLVWRGGVRPAWPFERAIAGPLLRNGAPLAAAAFLSLAYQHADKLMTTRFVDVTQTGYLAAAFVIIFGLVELLSTTILIATYPMMSRYYGDGSGAAFGFMVEKLAFFTLLIVLPLALVLSVFATELIVPLFGPAYLPTAAVLRVLIWYALMAMVANVFARGMTIQNRQRRLLGIRAAGLGFNITLNVLLIPQIGIIGAALASLAAEALVLLVLSASFHAVGLDLRRVLPRIGRLMVLATGVASLMIFTGGVQITPYALHLMGADWPVSGVMIHALHPVIGIALGLLTYAAGVLLLRILAPDDLDLLYRLAAAMPGGGIVRRFWRRDVQVNW